MAEKHIHIHLGAAPRKAAAKDARMFPSYTTAQLKERLGKGDLDPATAAKIKAEIEARESGESKVSVTPQIKPVWAKDASSRAELEQKLRVAQGRYDKLEPGVPLREKVALKQQIDDLKKQLAETKDAAPPFRKPNFGIADIAIGGTVIYKDGDAFRMSKVSSTSGMRVKLANGKEISVGDVWSTDASDWSRFRDVTMDAAPTESQFKAKVSEINQLLTDASRRCEQLAGQLDAGSLLEKCDKLEDLIDKARNYAFQIR